MPMYDFKCQVCGARRRGWRYAGQEPKYCSRECQSRGMAGRSAKPVKYVITPDMAAQIQRVYQTSTGNREVTELAEKFGVPRWKVSRYAVKQGWLPQTQKQPPWTLEEAEILERYAHLGPERIRVRLAAHGFTRSEAGIVLKSKRLNLLKNLDGQSATSLAACFGVDPSTVANWCKKGLLKHTMRGTGRTTPQGGDAYYIKDKDVRQFVVDNANLVDLRKVSKEWFIDIVAGRGLT